MTVYCFVPGQFRGFRDLEMFCREATSAWSKNGQIFPMYDPETKEIFECAFNAESGYLVAYASVSMAEFRKRLEDVAQRMIKDAMYEAMQKASKAVADLYAEIEFIELQR